MVAELDDLVGCFVLRIQGIHPNRRGSLFKIVGAQGSFVLLQGWNLHNNKKGMRQFLFPLSEIAISAAEIDIPRDEGPGQFHWNIFMSWKAAAQQWATIKSTDQDA